MSQQANGHTSAPKPDLSIYGLTTEEVQTLSQKCIEAKERAYCMNFHISFLRLHPGKQILIRCNSGRYSHFKVGATLLVKENAATASAGGSRFISGANVENAAYPVGTCAERVALGTAVFEGHRLGSFKALAVATNTEPGSPASPCGMCRQFIREFCEPNMPIIMHDRLDGQVVMTLEQV